MEHGKAYLPNMPPTGQNGVRSSVEVFVKVLSFLDISEADNELTVQLQLDVTWRDGRLTMNDLKEDRDLNTVTDAGLIWYPVLVFNNTKDKMISFVSLADRKVFVIIERKGGFRRSPDSELNNRYIYTGAENPITMLKVFNVDLPCIFDMMAFPFDTQECLLVLAMNGNMGKFVDLVGSGADYLGPTELTQHLIRTVEMLNSTTKDNAVRVRIRFGRRLLGVIMTTYLPTVLLCLVCFATNWFGPAYFEALVTVNLTSLLVLTTLFISFFDSLPSTSYLKMVDVWLVVALFVPFCEVLLHTAAEVYRDDGDVCCNWWEAQKGSAKIGPETRRAGARGRAAKRRYRRTIAKRLVNIGLPLVYFLFVLGYFVVGLSISKT